MVLVFIIVLAQISPIISYSPVNNFLALLRLGQRGFLHAFTRSSLLTVYKQIQTHILFVYMHSGLAEVFNRSCHQLYTICLLNICLCVTTKGCHITLATFCAVFRVICFQNRCVIAYPDFSILCIMGSCRLDVKQNKMFTS